MLTVALLGADGAGKTTVGRRVASELGVPVRYIYMGVNGEAASHALPTTRAVRSMKQLLGRALPEGGPPPVRSDTAGSAPKPRSGLIPASRSALRMANRIAEETYQQLVAGWHLVHGRVVVFDRFAAADYWAHDMDPSTRRSASRRLHGLFLRTCLRQPDEVIVLDAPAEVLFARKGEGTLASLERRRQEYLSYGQSVERFDVVDATAPLDHVVSQVTRLISRELDRKRAGGRR